MKTNKILYIVVGLILIGLATGFVLTNRSYPNKTIKIGAALGLSGECANYGENELKAAELAIDEANKSGGISSRRIELISEDMQCNPKGAVNAIRKLIDVDHVEAIVGLTWGDSFQAGYTVNNQAKVVSVAPSAALEALQYNNV